MPLSEYEQRVLEALERDLGTDPKLTTAMTRGRRSGTRLLAAGVGIVVGLGTVLAGVMAQLPLIGIAGFALMAVCALWAMTGGTRSGRPDLGSPKGTPSSKPKSKRQGFMTRLEERFERRREQGDL